jgi:hypothetical protein
MKDPKRMRLLAFLSAVLMLMITLTSGCVACKADLPPPSPTSINCSVSPTTVILGSSTAVSGSISPAVSNVTVTLTYTKPDATTIDRTETTASDGSFNETYTPDTAGSWSVKSSWAGNDNYLGSTSFDTTFTVSAPTGIPMEYVYVAVIVIVVVIIAIAAYWYRRKK